MPRRQLPHHPDIPFLQGLENSVGKIEGSLPRFPFDGAAQQVALGDHLEDRADVGGHSAVDEDQRCLQRLNGGLRDVGPIEPGVPGDQGSPGGGTIAAINGFFRISA